MGLSSSNGTIDPKCNGGFEVPPSEVEEIKNASIKVTKTASELLNAEPYVVDSNASKNTVDVSSQDIIDAISAYISGSNVTVTFYHNLNADTTGRSFQTDWSVTENSVHYSFLKINNFQMKVSGSFSFSYATDKVTSSQTGEAVLYPYFVPYQGDLFIYEVGDGYYGLYKITAAPERLSIRTSTCHKITFSLIRYLNSTEYKKMQECVDQEVYFNLKRYLADEGAFITSDENATLDRVNTAIQLLQHYYVEEFFDTDVYNTFIETVCLYDPYMLEFILRVFNISKLPAYPVQLVSDPANWKRSFWFRLLDPSVLPEALVISKCFRVLKTVNYRTAGINALTNRCYIKINANGKHPYPPFRIPEEYISTVKTVQMQVRLYLDQGKVRPPVLLSLVDQVYSASRSAQFYFIPILVFLLTKLKTALEQGDDIILGTTNDEATCSFDCENCIYACGTCAKSKFIPKPSEICDYDCKHCKMSGKCLEYIPDNGGSIDDQPYCGTNITDIPDTYFDA